MKQNTKSKAVLASATFLGLAAIFGLTNQETSWAVAGIFGLALLKISHTLRQPKLAVVRVRSQKTRSGASR